MTMKILIGYDGSECAMAAIEDLRRAGLPERAEANILTVADVWLPPTPEPARSEAEPALLPAVLAARTLATQAVEDAKALSHDGAARVRACFPEWTVTAEAMAESPYWALIKRSQGEQWRPDLLVVGSHGRSLAGRLVMGSVSQMALHHAPCSVRVGRSHLPFSEGMSVRIVVGVDGSPEAAAAIRAVARRNWPAGSEATVVAAADMRLATSVVGFFSPGDDALMWARRAADEAADELRAVGLAVTSVVVEGDPKRVLVAVAAERGAHCIFVGAQGLGRLDRFLIGSVSSAVAARAHCSVEVIRRADPD